MVDNAPQDKLGLNFLAAIFPLALIAIVLIKAWPLIVALIAISAIYKTWQHYQWQEWSAKIDPTFQALIIQNQGCITITDLAISGNLTARAAKLFLERKADEFGAQVTVKNETKLYFFWTTSALASVFASSEPPTEQNIESSIRITSMPTGDDEPGDFLAIATTPAAPTPDPVWEEPQGQINPSLSSGQNSPETIASVEPTADGGGQTHDDDGEEEPSSINYFLDDDDDEDDEREEDDGIGTEDIGVDLSQSINYFPDDDEDDGDDDHQTLPTQLIQSELSKRLNVHPSTVAKFRNKANFAQWTKGKDPDGLAWSYIRRTKMYVVVED